MKKLILLLTILFLGYVSNAQYCTSKALSNSLHEIKYTAIFSSTGSLQCSSSCNSLIGTGPLYGSVTAGGNSQAGTYSDFTTSSIFIPKLRKGNTHSITVNTTANCTNNLSGGIRVAYFDWNADGDFIDSNEKYVIDSIYSTDSAKFKYIIIPMNSSIGITRMRIVYRNVTSLSMVQPCDSNLYAGETEDYNVEIVNCNQQVSFQKSWSGTIGSSLFIYPIITPFDTFATYVWTKNGNNVGTNMIYQDSIVLNSDTGTYCVKVTFSNGCVIESCTQVSGCQTAVNTTNQDSMCWSNTKFCTGTPAGGTWSVVSGGGTCSGPDYNHPIVTSPVYVTIRYTIAATANCPSSTSDRSFWVLPCLPAGPPKCAEFKTISYTKAGGLFHFTSSGPSSVASPYTVRYNWTFSNGTTSTQKNPSQVNFTTFPAWAKLSVCIDSGSTTICCDSSLKDSIKGCQLSCNIIKTGNYLFVMKSNGTAPYTYNWGAGATADSAKLASAPGTYSVTVIDGAGCSTTCSYIVAPSSPCQGKEILVSYLGNTVVFSTNIPSGNHSYNWTFGDSATVNNSPNPSHTYAGVGFYLAKLKFCLRDSAQNIICCDSIMRTIAIYPPCNVKANFNWSSTSNGGTYQFIDSTTPFGTNYSYQWNFGDSTFGYSKNPVKTYTKNGVRTVCLIVTKYANTNNQVCRDTICKTINVTNVNPCNRFVPNFTWATTGGAYQFNNTTNLTGFNIVSVNFNISTGASYNYNNPVHTFINNGYYSVTMTMTIFDATTGTNCTKSITKYISVNASICGCLKAYYSYSKTGMTVNFNNLSTCDSGASYLYKYGNGATSTTKNPSYTYTLPGLYRVVLIVTRTVGATTCVDSTVKFIQITSPNPCKDSAYQSSQFCSDYVSPVCGCDSVTYKNYCEGSKKGVKQYYTGPCPNDTTYVKICGYVYNDFNKNCAYDTTDGKLANVPIKFNSTPIRYAYTNAAGFYTIYLPKGTYQLTQILTNSTFPRHQLCPASNGSITVAATTGGMTYCNNNFYDTMNTCQDLATSIHRIANITPGFTSMKYIKYQNNGATPITGVVLKYRFMAGLTVKSTTSATYTVSGNVITWNLGTIAPYSIGYKYAHFNTPITGIALGTTVIDSVWIEPINGDCNPANNLATYKDTCVGSWDPNDKAAYPADNIDTSIKQLDYLVRFQNTGTAPAHNVLIEDQIDANFDRSSLDIKASSHAMTHHYDDAGKLFFEFANIMLPDSGTDYDASQGYVAYSLKLKDGLAIGTQLKNTAHIFFDFNEAVITNTTVNTIVLKSTTGVQNQGKDMNISIFPNPTADRATIFIKLDKASQVSYSLYDLQGKLIFQNGSDKSHTGEFNQDLSLEGLTKGIYLLNITVNGKESSFKLVKE